VQHSTVQEHRDEFDDRNSFLYFVLGMISLSYSVMGSLGLPGQDLTGPADQPTPPATAEEPSSDPLRISLLR
jgi:hypothetical protein